MSASNAAETAMAKLIFQAVAWANIADNAASSPATNTQVALHTADPGETGTQATSECTYTSYARTAVARTTGGWAEASGVITPVANIDAPACTGGTNTVTHASVAISNTNTGTIAIFASGTVTPNISVSTGVTPRLTTASTITFD